METETSLAADDDALMAAYQGGDQDAFGLLYERYAPMLRRILRRGGLGDEETSDLVQESFLHLHRARADYRSGGGLRPWLVTIALNLKREHLRRRGRRPEAALDERAEERAGVAAHDAAAADRSRAVHAALQELPEGQRQVIVLHWFEEFSFPEISRILGVGLSATKVRAHRGYGRLREWLEHRGHR